MRERRGNVQTTWVDQDSPSGSLPNTIPLTTRLASNPPPSTFTTLTESTLKSLGFMGMTANAASATSEARNFSEPGCLEARDGATADASWDEEGRGNESIVDETRAMVHLRQQ